MDLTKSGDFVGLYWQNERLINGVCFVEWPSNCGTFVLLIGVCLGRWVILQEKESVPLVKLEKNSIVPGERKAVLVLSDGEHVDLRDTMQVEIVERETRIFVAGDSTRLVVKDSPIDPSLHTVFTPVGGEYKLTLSDGTRVWLNASSRIQFSCCIQE